MATDNMMQEPRNHGSIQYDKNTPCKKHMLTPTSTYTPPAITWIHGHLQKYSVSVRVYQIFVMFNCYVDICKQV